MSADWKCSYCRQIVRVDQATVYVRNGEPEALCVDCHDSGDCALLDPGRRAYESALFHGGLEDVVSSRVLVHALHEAAEEMASIWAELAGAFASQMDGEDGAADECELFQRAIGKATAAAEAIMGRGLELRGCQA